MRIGIFGGSFDPVHVGHVQLAAACRDEAALDAVWFVPAARQPFKPEGPVATDEDRCAMLELAIAGEPGMSISTIELDRAGVSYTVDTLRAIAAARPADELFLLLGADTLADLPSWREPAEISRLATPLVVARAGELEMDFDVFEQIVSTERLADIRALHVSMPPADVSSTEIRERIAIGGSIEGLVAADVAKYIAENGLYAKNDV